jgi:hypothetical protein
MFQSVGKGAERTCIGLYSALCFFTTQFITRHGRRGMRQFINSSMENIHDPEMLARYVIAPVNHILIPQRNLLIQKKSIAVDAAPWQKLNWVTRHILFQRMLGILSAHGLQPECEYISGDQKEFIRWVVEESDCGRKQKDGCMGVTQMVFLQYARNMAPANLYETLSVPSKSRLTGEAVFREKEHRRLFINDDYGLKASNHINEHFKSIIEGRKEFEHEHLLEQFTKAKSGKKPRKRVSPKKKATTEETITKPQPEPDIATPGAPTELRKSVRQEGGPPKHYLEDDTNDEIQEEGTVTDERGAKRTKTCQHCTSLVSALRELETQASDLTKDKIVERLHNALGENLSDDTMLATATE